MPFYTFINPTTGEEIDVMQKMTDEHIYVDEHGLEWRREYTPTNFTIDGRVNPMSQTEFLNKTAEKKDTLGDVQDRAKEMSEKRKDKYGYDPIQKKWFESYSKRRKGKKHPSDPSRKTTFEA